MKVLALVCLLAVAASAQKLKVPQTTPEEIKAILATEAGAREFVDCVQKPNSCRDPRAHSVARLAPFLWRTQGKCKNVQHIKCTAKDEENIRLAINILSTRYNKLYSRFMRSLVRSAGK